MKATEKYDSRAKLWSRRYEIASDNQTPVFKKVSGFYRTYYAAINTKDYAPWRSKVFIPVLASKTRTLVAKFTGLKPGFEVSVRNPDNADDQTIRDAADKAQQKLEYDYDNPCFDEPMREKLFSPLMDATVAGLGIAKTPWVRKNTSSYVRPVDEFGNVVLSREQVTDSEQGYNDLIPVNFFNFFYDPGARSVQGASWLMIREHKSYQYLKDMNDANGGKLYKNLDQVKDMRAQSDKWAQYNRSRNQIQNTQDPIADDDTLDQIELFECYEKSNGTITTFAVGNTKNKDTQWVEIRRQKNPYWHGRYPIVPFYILRRPYQLMGQGIFEDTERLQAATNDIFNHFMDSVNLSIDGMLMVNENSDVDDFVVQPGGVIYYRGQTKPEQYKFSDPNPALFNTVFQTIEGAIESATISQYASGTPNSATDKTAGTATGIMRLQEAAGDLVSFMRSNFQTSIRTVGQHWLSNNRQFMSSPLTLPSTQSQNEMVNIDPADLQYEMDLRIDDASMQPLSKQDRLQQYLTYQQQVLTLQQQSIAQHQALGTEPIALNFPAIFEEMSQEFGQKNADKFTLAPEEVQAAQQQQMQEMAMQQQAQGMPPGQPGQPDQGFGGQEPVQPQGPSVDDEITHDAQAMQQQGII